jgi:hypothetical protein
MGKSLDVFRFSAPIADADANHLPTLPLRAANPGFTALLQCG